MWHWTWGWHHGNPPMRGWGAVIFLVMLGGPYLYLYLRYRRR